MISRFNGPIVEQEDERFMVLRSVEEIDELVRGGEGNHEVGDLGRKRGSGRGGNRYGGILDI